MEGSEPGRDPGMPRGLLAPDWFLALAQIQVKPLTGWVSKQRNRR